MSHHQKIFPGFFNTHRFSFSLSQHLRVMGFFTAQVNRNNIHVLVTGVYYTVCDDGKRVSMLVVVVPLLLQLYPDSHTRRPQLVICLVGFY